MSPAIRTQLETLVSAETVYEPVCQLFAAVFGAPPLNRPPRTLASQRRSLRSLMSEPTFGLTTAWDDAQLVGFAYGHAVAADSHWWDGLLEPVAEEVTKEWDGRTFAVIDMGVAQSHQKVTWRVFAMRSRHPVAARLIATQASSRILRRGTSHPTATARSTI